MKKLYLILPIGLVVILILQFPHAMISPGELTKGHQNLNSDCFACHTPLQGITNVKCISCHTVAEIGMDTTGTKPKTAFHQLLSDQQCSSCHSDHQGVVPVQRRGSFKHSLLPQSTIDNCKSCHQKPSDNLHAQLTANCNSCHQSQSWKNVTSFNHELLLNKSNCATCHQAPKDNVHSLSKDNCYKCHSTTQWEPSTFDHSAYFVLDRHHTTTCTTCHSNNTFSTYSCYGCHEHSESSIIAEHSEEGISNISNCVSCHQSGNEHDIRHSNKSRDEDE